MWLTLCQSTVYRSQGIVTKSSKCTYTTCRSSYYMYYGNLHLSNLIGYTTQTMNYTDHNGTTVLKFQFVNSPSGTAYS